MLKTHPTGSGVTNLSSDSTSSGVAGVGSGVDQQNGLGSDHQADVLIEELVSAAEDPVAQFLPTVWRSTTVTSDPTSGLVSSSDLDMNLNRHGMLTDTGVDRHQIGDRLEISPPFLERLFPRSPSGGYQGMESGSQGPLSPFRPVFPDPRARISRPGDREAAPYLGRQAPAAHPRRSPVSSGRFLSPS